jgi:hypothetical protein
MKIDVNCTNQMLTWNRDAQVDIYTCVQEAVQKTEWMRLAGIGIAVASGTIALIKAVGVLVESIIKGIANVFGGLCSKDFSIAKGVQQLFLNTPVAIICVPIILLIVAINLTVTPIWMTIDPDGCSKYFLEANLTSEMHTLSFWC